MFYAAGIREIEDIKAAKHETMLDIVASEYTYTHDLTERINAYSRGLSGSRKETSVTEPAPIAIGIPAQDALAFSKG